MQVVIEISDETYEYISYEAETSIDESNVVEAVRKGIVLPKGHGRLGDLDELETYFKNVRKELKPADYKYAVEFFTRDNMLLNAEQFIHLMDAVIPADKEGD